MLLKLLLFPLLALGLGWGYLSDTSADAASKALAQCVLDCLPDCADECEIVAVECTPAGTCLVTCEAPDGRRCEVELDCDGSCSLCVPASEASQASQATPVAETVTLPEPAAASCQPVNCAPGACAPASCGA